MQTPLSDTDGEQSSCTWPWIVIDSEPQPIFGFAIRHEDHTTTTHESVASQLALLKEFGVVDIRWLFDPTEGLHPTPKVGETCTWCEDSLLADGGFRILLTFVCWRDDDIVQGTRTWFANWFRAEVPFRDGRPYFLHPAFRKCYARFVEWYGRRQLPIVAVSFFNEPLIEYEVDDEWTRRSFEHYLVVHYNNIETYNLEHSTNYTTWQEAMAMVKPYDLFMWRTDLIPQLLGWAKGVYETANGKKNVMFGSNLILSDPWVGTGLEVSDRGRDPAAAALQTDLVMGDIYSNDLGAFSVAAKLLRGCSARTRPIVLHEIGGEHFLPWPDIELQRKILYLLFGHGITSMYLWGPGFVGMPSPPIALSHREREFDVQVRELWDLVLKLDARPNPWLTEYSRTIGEIRALMGILGSMKPIDPEAALVYSQHTMAAGHCHALEDDSSDSSEVPDAFINPSGQAKTSGHRLTGLADLSQALSNLQIQHDIVSDLNVEREFLPNARHYLMLGTCFPHALLDRIDRLASQGSRFYGIDQTPYVDLAGRHVDPPFSAFLPREALAAALAARLDSGRRHTQLRELDGSLATGIEVLPWENEENQELLFLVNKSEGRRRLRLTVGVDGVSQVHVYSRETGWKAEYLDANGEATVLLRDMAILHVQ